MKSKTSIAIYSGEIPSTTFIERLIVGIADTNIRVYLFGKQKSKINYPKSIKTFRYSTNISRYITVLRYTVLLTFFKPNAKKKLDSIIASQKGSKKIKQLKYYPVLYHKPDVFHLQWAKGVEEWLWVKEFGIKLILSLRGTHISISPVADISLKEKYIANFHKVDGFHAVSKAILVDAKKYEPNLKNTSVIYSGIDLDKLIYKPKTTLNNELKILSIGRSHWLKGYNYALDAFSILRQENFNFQYTIIGIENEEELVFQRNQLNLDEFVTFHKRTPFQNIIEQIVEADIVLLPSLEEGVANVVIEAMALGTLVISTDCGGMTEVVKNNENGFIVPIRNSNAIADAIRKVSTITLDDYTEITSRARLTVENQHSKEKMISDFKAFYDIVSNEKQKS